MTSDTTLVLLKITAVLTALMGVLQAVLGFLIVGGTWVGAHGMIGNTTVVVALVTAVVAFVWMRASANKGLFMHAVGVLVLAVAQVALGEMGLRTVHIVVGVLFLLAAVPLATLAIRKPGMRLERIDPARLQGH